MNKLDQMEVDITVAYDDLDEARKLYVEAEEASIEAKQVLELEKLKALAGGLIEGKNEDMRKAAARDLLKKHYDALDAAEKKARSEKLDLDLAASKVEYLRALIRIYEIASRMVE